MPTPADIRPAGDNRQSRVLLASVGGLGFAAQVVLLRELLATFSGNELAAGVALAVWILCEALGAWLFGRAGDERAPVLLPWLGLASIAASLVGVPATILARPALRLLPSEAVGIPAVAGITLTVLLLPAASHGALFVAASACRKTGTRSPVSSVGLAYVWEGLGTFAAGLVASFVLLNRLPSLAVVALLALPVAATVTPRSRPLAGTFAATLLLIAVLAPGLERRAWAAAWPGQHVASVINTHYGKVVRLERAEQRTVLYDGAAVMNLPVADIERTEELVHLSLLAHAAPRRVLMLGQALGGFLAEALKHPVSGVTLVQLDPALSRELEVAGGGAVRAQLADARVHYLSADPVTFLRRSSDTFDCIIFTDATPATISANRLFAVEFYALCRARLRPGGILAIPGPGSSTQLTPGVRAILAVRKRSLETAFPYVALLSADFPLFLASGVPLWTRPDTLSTRLCRLGIPTRVIDSAYLTNLLGDFRTTMLTRELSQPQEHAARLNTWAVPTELFLNVARESRLASAASGQWYEALGRTPTWFAWLFVALLAATGLIGARARGKRFVAGLAVFTSGMVGASVMVLSVIGYQVRFGSVYSGVSLLVAAFTLGTVFGGIAGTRPSTNRASGLLFGAADIALLACAASQPVLARTGSAADFLIVLCLAGACLGLQFALAGALLHARGVGRRTGMLSSLDLAGGFLGGLGTALFLLPVYGLVTAALVAAGIKLASLLGQLPVRPAAN
jgi:spermidine synthase